MRALHALYGAMLLDALGERYVGCVWPVLLSPCCCMRGCRLDRITALESAATASEWLLLVGLGCQGECL